MSKMLRLLDQIKLEPRLITSLNPTGKVFWQDDFEQYTAAVTEKWTQNAGTISFDTTKPFRGKNAMKLLTGAVAGNVATAAKIFGLMPEERLGMEFWFLSQSGVANIRRIAFEIQYFDGTNIHYFSPFWVGTEGGLQQKWKYVGAAWAELDIPSGAQKLYVEAASPIWHHLKATVDVQKDEYLKLICDEKTFNLRGLDCTVDVDASLPQFYITIFIITETATAISLFVDDLILTDQEP